MKSRFADNLPTLLGLVCGHHGKSLLDGEYAYERERVMVATLPQDCGWEGVLERYHHGDPFQKEIMLLALLFLSEQKEIRGRLSHNFDDPFSPDAH